MEALTYALALLNVGVMALAFMGKRSATIAAAISAIVIQGPWTLWDLYTHNYGFLLISAATVAVAGYTLWKETHGPRQAPPA